MVSSKELFDIDISYTSTADGLNLMGVHYAPSAKGELVVLHIHGLAGNFLENYFGHIIGSELAKSGVGFVYAHNRGYSLINDIRTTKRTKEGGYKTRRVGAAYERFVESVFDIEAWIDKVRKLGYKKVILFGHSFGCNKIVYYFYKKQPKDIAGVVLGSPPDMIGLAKRDPYPDSLEETLKEAREMVKRGKGDKLLKGLIWNWYYLSAQTFLELAEEGSPADNLPVAKNPKRFEQLKMVDVPILAFMGERDEVIIKSAPKELALLGERATACPSFEKKIIPKANHAYSDKEKLVAKEILDWTDKEIVS